MQSTLKSTAIIWSQDLSPSNWNMTLKALCSPELSAVLQTSVSHNILGISSWMPQRHLNIDDRLIISSQIFSCSAYPPPHFHFLLFLACSMSWEADLYRLRLWVCMWIWPMGGPGRRLKSEGVRGLGIYSSLLCEVLAVSLLDYRFFLSSQNSQAISGNFIFFADPLSLGIVIAFHCC